jgi:hypothetical protein
MIPEKESLLNNNNNSNNNNYSLRERRKSPMSSNNNTEDNNYQATDYLYQDDFDNDTRAPPPLLEIPEETYAVRKAALEVLKPLTKTWVSNESDKKN